MNGVVVTGLGVVAPHGDDPEAMFRALMQGESAIRPVFPDWNWIASMRAFWMLRSWARWKSRNELNVQSAENVLRRRLFAALPSSGRVGPPALRSSSSELTVFFRPSVLRRMVSSDRPTGPPFWQPYGHGHQPALAPWTYMWFSIMSSDSSKIDWATFWCRGGSIGRSPA